MRHHYHETVFRYLFKYIHDLQACFRIESTGRLVCENDVGIIYQCTGDSHSLHLTARHFRRLLAQLRSEPHILKSFYRAGFSLCLRYSRECERKLDVLQYRLMRNEVIALENKAYRMISVRIPVAVAEILCGSAVYHEITLCIFVKSADDIEQGSLTAAGRTEDGNKFVSAEAQVDAAQGVHRHIARRIILYYAFKLQHLNISASFGHYF